LRRRPLRPTTRAARLERADGALALGFASRSADRRPSPGIGGAESDETQATSASPPALGRSAEDARHDKRRFRHAKSSPRAAPRRRSWPPGVARRADRGQIEFAGRVSGRGLKAIAGLLPSRDARPQADGAEASDPAAERPVPPRVVGARDRLPTGLAFGLAKDML